MLLGNRQPPQAELSQPDENLGVDATLLVVLARSRQELFAGEVASHVAHHLLFFSQ